MRTSLRAGFSALVLASAVAACATGPGAEPERRMDGPLNVSNPYTTWFEVREGEVFSDGWLILTTTADLTIDRVSITGDTKPLTFLGARIGLPGRPNDFHQRMRGFPPKAVPARLQVPAEGATIEEGDTYMLILGFRVDEAKVSTRETVEIDYSVGTTTYTATIPGRLVTCPSPVTDTQCRKRYPPPASHAW